MAVTAGLAVAPVTWAAPTGTLTFDTPSAIVGPNDAIPVFLTLSLAPGSTALVTDASGMVLSGYDDSELPMNFHVDDSGIGQVSGCGGTFNNHCGSDAPYDFSFFKVETQQPLLPDLDLQPGQSVSFLFGTFRPTNGPVNEGTYTHDYLGLSLQFTDFSKPDPDEPTSPSNTYWSTSFSFVQTCDNSQNACNFQRTVVAAVPEPETYAMLLAGLGLIGWVVRRRTRNC